MASSNDLPPDKPYQLTAEKVSSPEFRKALCRSGLRIGDLIDLCDAALIGLQAQRPPKNAPQAAQGETPRTDNAQCTFGGCDSDAPLTAVYADCLEFARQLERELAEKEADYQTVLAGKRFFEERVARLSAPFAIAPLTDAEIVAAWNGAGSDRPEDGAADLYLHYMRAIAKAQRDKAAPTESDALAKFVSAQQEPGDDLTRAAQVAQRAEEAPLRPGLEAVQTYLRGAYQTSTKAADILDNLEAFIVNELSSDGPEGKSK